MAKMTIATGLAVAAIALSTGMGVRQAATQPGSAATQAVTPDVSDIRRAGEAVMDPEGVVNDEVLKLIHTESALEARFAREMLLAMRAEQAMFFKTAKAATGGEESVVTKMVRQAAANNRLALRSGEVTVDKEEASLLLSAGQRKTPLFFRRVDGVWKVDLLRAYRSRNQIDERGIGRWKAKQRAAAEVTRLYESKEETALPRARALYETMSGMFEGMPAGEAATTGAASTRP